jgi:hypothetical protein
MQAVEKNFNRLCGDEYGIDRVFQPDDYDWYGDWEGRALLAFNCLYEITGRKISTMEKMIEKLEDKTQGKLYFGKPFDGEIADEQQLSGHNWYLRGLLKHVNNFGGEIVEKSLYNTVNALYEPIIEWYKRYPLEREKLGGVSGEVVQIANGWKLSSDVGCAYMCVDGVAHYYEQTKDQKSKDFLDEVLAEFCKTDFVKRGFQTHTTLTCLRGVLRLYCATGDNKYLDIVKEKFELYLKFGMTLTYENFNWFGREDSWTEPCAVVDSFILATELYKITGEKRYLTLSRRIWFNGLQFCQRENGGAGPNTCVTKNNPILKISMYEAPFCCTMRYSEGLLEYHNNDHLFGWDENKPIEIDEIGRKFIDDRLLVEVQGKVVPIFSCRDIEKERAERLELKIIFD